MILQWNDICELCSTKSSCFLAVESSRRLILHKLILQLFLHQRYVTLLRLVLPVPEKTPLTMNLYYRHTLHRVQRSQRKLKREKKDTELNAPPLHEEDLQQIVIMHYRVYDDERRVEKKKRRKQEEWL